MCRPPGSCPAHVPLFNEVRLSAQNPRVAELGRDMCRNDEGTQCSGSEWPHWWLSPPLTGWERSVLGLRLDRWPGACRGKRSPPVLIAFARAGTGAHRQTRRKASTSGRVFKASWPQPGFSLSRVVVRAIGGGSSRGGQETR